jgi:hypothetical protein
MQMYLRECVFVEKRSITRNTTKQVIIIIPSPISDIVRPEKKRIRWWLTRSGSGPFIFTGHIKCSFGHDVYVSIGIYLYCKLNSEPVPFVDQIWVKTFGAVVFCVISSRHFLSLLPGICAFPLQFFLALITSI